MNAIEVQRRAVRPHLLLRRGRGRAAHRERGRRRPRWSSRARAGSASRPRAAAAVHARACATPCCVRRASCAASSTCASTRSTRRACSVEDHGRARRARHQHRSRAPGGAPRVERRRCPTRAHASEARARPTCDLALGRDRRACAKCVAPAQARSASNGSSDMTPTRKPQLRRLVRARQAAARAAARSTEVVYSRPHCERPAHGRSTTSSGCKTTRRRSGRRSSSRARTRPSGPTARASGARRRVVCPIVDRRQRRLDVRGQHQPVLGRALRPASSGVDGPLGQAMRQLAHRLASRTSA